MTVDEVIITDALRRRPRRKADYRAENRLIHLLAKSFGKPQDHLLHKLVAKARILTKAGSSGLSLLEKTPKGEIFRWVALDGEYRSSLGGSSPGGFSPCGTCLERNAVVLYLEPQRFFKYLAKVEPSVYEALVVPVAAGLNKLGTIWIVSHESRRSFDAEDARLISSIATVAGAVLGQRRLQLETEEALRAARHSQQFTERVLGSSPDCIKILDAKGNILFMNEPGLAALKATLPDVLNKNWFSFWRGGDRALARRAFRDAQLHGEGRFQGFRPTFSNDAKWWDVIISPLPDGAGETGRFLALSRDITERVLSAKALADANSRLAKDARQLEQRVRERTGELEQAHRRVVTLAGKLVRSQEDERRTIARELHDEVGQKLTAFRLLLERASPKGRVNGQEVFARLLESVGDLQERVRTLSFALRQAFPEHITLEAALRWHFKDLRHATKLNVRFRWAPFAEEDVGVHAKHAAFRIVQEALTNVLRHARVPQATVSVERRNGVLQVSVSDCGAGFSLKALGSRASTGLSSMEERVVLLGGKFSIASRPQHGTKVLAEIPIDGGSAAKVHP